MDDHLFYFGLLFAVIMGFSIIAPGNTITGLSVGDCPECGKLCDDHDECGGLICCPTEWESGVCHHPNSCAAITAISGQMSYQEYANPETPQAIRNIAWKTFALPMLIVIGLIAAVVYWARSH